jgi:hypothetical protein
MFKHIFFGLLLSSLAYSKSSSYLLEQQCQTYRCQAVVDAGSSGTRFYIYGLDTANQAWHLLWETKMNPGLSSIQAKQVDSYLNQLIQAPLSVVMPLHFYGTAGMRLLSQNEQEQRYQAVRAWMNQHPQWQLTAIGTLSGQDEGIYAWLAVQAEMHHLDKSFPDLSGVVEIGGASAQVTVPLEFAEVAKYPAQEIATVTVNGKKIYLWSKSYLGLGLNEVEQKMQSASACFSQGYPLPMNQVGHGDFGQCVQALETNQEINLLARLSEIKAVLNRHQNLSWVGLGVLKYTPMSSAFHFPSSDFDLEELGQQGDTVCCHQAWSDVFGQFEHDPYLYRQCLTVSYLYSYLIDGMGLKAAEHIYYPHQDEVMDWTLGVLLANK